MGEVKERSVEWWRRRGEEKHAVLVFEAQDGSQESRPRCVVVVYRHSDRGGLLETTSHRFIAVAAANHRVPCQDAWPAIPQSFGACHWWRKRPPVVAKAFGAVSIQGTVFLLLGFEIAVAAWFVLIKHQINPRNQNWFMLSSFEITWCITGFLSLPTFGHRFIMFFISLSSNPLTRLNLTTL